MKRLILTGENGTPLTLTDLAEVAVVFCFRFVAGPLPSPDELTSYVAARSDKHGPGSHWSDYSGRWRQAKARKDLGLIEFCEPYDEVELWFDPGPNDQLQLIWLLDFFRSHPETAAKLRLRLVDFPLLKASPVDLGHWQVPVIDDVTGDELETASAAWQAYRATTPEGCFGLLSTDLSALPLLRPALIDLLEELPSAVTGLGATEMRFLEMIARRYDHPNELFHIRGMRRTRVFGEIENGYLLDGLAHGPKPAVAGLDDELRTLSRENHRGRHAAYLRSRLSLTEFGEAIVAHKEDFSRHNPIDRWWGGTRLTNDRLWRWSTALVAP